MLAAKGFNGAGTVLSAYISKTPPPFIRKRRYRGARARGVNYERRTHPYLESLYPDTYLQNPWLNFESEESVRRRWCQPDGLIIDIKEGRITCIEIKYSHTADAWFQTRQLYIPVLEVIFPPTLWTLEVCEVVKWYDSAVMFPETVELADEPTRSSQKFKVHIFKP